jgi:hypothetical protein
MKVVFWTWMYWNMHAHFFLQILNRLHRRCWLFSLCLFYVLLMFVLVYEILICSFHAKILTIVQNEKTTNCFVVLTIFNILHINGTKVTNIDSIAFHYTWCSLNKKYVFFQNRPHLFSFFPHINKDWSQKYTWPPMMMNRKSFNWYF